MNSGSRLVVAPVGPLVIAVLGLEPSIGRATTVACAAPMSAMPVDTRLAISPAGVAFVVAVRWPERCVTPKRSSPVAWPATFMSAVQVATLPSTVGLTVVIPVVAPGIASQAPAWSTAIEGTGASPAFGLRSVTVNALSSSGWTSVLSALKASVSGIEPSGPNAASEPRVLLPLAGISAGQPIAAAGSGWVPQLHVSASGCPAAMRPKTASKAPASRRAPAASGSQAATRRPLVAEPSQPAIEVPASCSERRPASAPIAQRAAR